MCSALVPTASPAAKATTLTSAPGNKPRGAAAGFSLLELMVVMLLVAVATGMVTLSLRDSSQSKLEEEGARLSAILESARTQSRIIGTDVRWQPLKESSGFEFVGLPATAAAELPSKWLDSDTKAEILGEPQLRLGPEPLLAPQRVVLRLNDHEIAIGTDGLAPFQVVVPGDAAVAPQ